MPIELTCGGCGGALRVPDEHAGKQARCPVCNTIMPIPSSSPFGGPPPSAAWSGQPISGSPTAGPPQNPFQRNPIASSPFENNNPYASSAEASNPLNRGAPHRGGLILTFGITGLCCCPFLGIAAWVMGQQDLSAMRKGRMDPSGHTLTQVGMILGIVDTVFMGLGILANIAQQFGG